MCRSTFPVTESKMPPVTVRGNKLRGKFGYKDVATLLRKCYRVLVYFVYTVDESVNYWHDEGISEMNKYSRKSREKYRRVKIRRAMIRDISNSKR